MKNRYNEKNNDIWHNYFVQIYEKSCFRHDEGKDDFRMKKYSSDVLFPKGKNSKEIIPNTEFMGQTTEEVFHSVKNNKRSPFTGHPMMTLSYKIGSAIACSQTKDFNIYRGEKDGKEFYLGCFSGGSKSNKEYFLMDFENKEFMTTNMYSHLLFKLMIAYGRYKEPNGELDKYFRLIRFENDEGQQEMICADQKKQFFISADALYYLALETFLNKEFDDDAPVEEFKEYIPYLKDDITGFVKNEYKGKVSESSLDLGIGTLESIVLPKEKKKVIPLSKRAKAIKEKYYNGIKTFKDEEINAMPALLRNGYELAQASFKSNRDFFDNEMWMLVDAIALGDVRAINFTGPAGTGKTTTIRSIAGALGMPFVLVGGSANIEESDLLGTRNVEAVDGTSVTTWTDGPITTAIRYGAFLLFDEVNAADPGILMKLNTILDGSKSLILSTAEEVRVHPKFVYSEAMNVGAAYAGTDQMNQSHFDRMDEIFKISAKTPEEEAEIIAANTGYENMENLVKMCLIKQAIMKAIEEEGDASEQICSPRRMICWAKKAKRTGEFIQSSLSTVIAHLSVYDDSFDKLTKEAVLESSGIASNIMEKIINSFQDVEY